MPRTDGPPRRKRQRVHVQAPADATDDELDAQEQEGNQDYSHGQGGEGVEDGPACQSCRRRKSRCSKQQPCEQCERLKVECMYDDRRRPGYKTGVIEALTKRLANLEQMFLGQALLLQGKLAPDPGNGIGPLVDLAAAADDSQRVLRAATAQVREQSLQAASQQTLHTASPSQPIIPIDPPRSRSGVQNETLADAAHDDPLPSESIVRDLVEWYFQNTHRWIPVLHQRRFREDLDSPEGRSKADTILLSITSVCLRFERPPSMSEPTSEAISTRCRHAVILRSMECFSVESLQALVILAFDIIGRGQGPSSWSIIGSMARTVEQLRLDTESPVDAASGNDKHNYLMRRMTFLPRPKTWVEEEERRRVFWCVFMMDRFCSVATGWSNSIARAEVRRRLPCEGSIWKREVPVQTPFFDSDNGAQVSTPTSERLTHETEAVEHIGGFAFCLEASDNLNLVSSFFLQREVKFEGPQQVRLWLLRFKELDLRLVKWRLSLPEKWREASVLNQDGIMDPNLTLAHITQNTAVIQLHQCVAFPPAALRACRMALPSTSSAETCVSAAYEIGTIAQQFLQQSSGITHPQLGFCLFIAGRVLLAHAMHHGTAVHSVFTTISAALQEISARWDHRGNQQSASSSHNNLASRLHSRLLSAQAAMNSSVTQQTNRIPLDVGRPVYSEDRDRSRATSVNPTTHGEPQTQPHQDPIYHAGAANIFGAHIDGNQPTLAPLPPMWDDQANLFANCDLGADLFSMPQAPGGGEAEGEEADFAWMSGLEGVFDEQFEQMLRVSNYADTAAY